MHPDHNESPFNPLPAILWVIAGLLALPEVVFLLGDYGLFGGGGMTSRIGALQMTAWIPEIVLQGWPGAIQFDQIYRLLTYSFVSMSAMNTLFVIAFTLALGKAVSAVFSQGAIAAVFFGAAIGGAVVHTLFAALPGAPSMALTGGYPAAYGMIGAFTWLLWMRLKASGDNPARAFGLIGALILIQAIFAILYRYVPTDWAAEFAGFAIGFFLSFVVSPGGLRRLRQR